ncbi:hypothetical protein ACFJIS_21340 [Variovorax boronicumulans]|jgi:hypothetical protein|uniref:hypothetical protein n=1 Tax=Variovorax boronicumulans TaxID=436515 RepID=UPI0036F336AD
MNATASANVAAVKDVDIRGFAYALEPLRQRRRWQLDAALAALAQAQRLLDETEARLSELREAHDTQARALSEAALRRLDAGAHRRALAYLTHLRERAKLLEAERDAQRLARDQQRRDCIDRQLRQDGLEKHKQDALTDFADDVRRRLANEQDRDWLARSAAGFGSKEPRP